MRKLLIGWFILFTMEAFGQLTSSVSLTDFVKESQIWNRNDDRMTLSWWIPKDYWKISLAGNTQIPPGTVDLLEGIFENYVLVCAADMAVGQGGLFTFTDEAEVRKSIVVVDSQGNKYLPLSNDQLTPGALEISERLRPVLAQALGEMGKGMYFYFFVVQNEKKENLIDANKVGRLIVAHSNAEFIWNLPMTALLPPKACPVDQAPMKGNWSFCPQHGVKLRNQ